MLILYALEIFIYFYQIVLFVTNKHHLRNFITIILNIHIKKIKVIDWKDVYYDKKKDKKKK